MFIKQRSKTRRIIMQALYMADMSGKEYLLAGDEILEDFDIKQIDLDYFNALLTEISKCDAELIIAIEPLLTDRTFAEVEPVERAILRLAAYEMMARHDVPYKVVINEAIELAKQYGSNESHGFINAVLDQLAKSHRQIELKAAHRNDE